MSLLLLFGQAASSNPAANFSMTITQEISGAAFAVLRNSRESMEALEAFTPGARNSRESIETIETFVSNARNSRESIEGIWQLVTPTFRDSRLSIEVLQGPILNKVSWGFIPIV